MNPHSRLPVFLICLWWMVGCATAPPIENRPPDAAEFMTELDRTVAMAGVRNAAAVSIPGFPYLRINRFLASFTGRLKTDTMRTAWIDTLQELDSSLRESEIAALPGDSISRRRLMDQAAEASNQLRRHDAMNPAYVEKVQEAIRIPDEYCPLMRVMGLYPLVAVPVILVTENVWEKFIEWHRTPADRLPVIGRLSVSGPETTAPSNLDFKTFWNALPETPLGIPQISEAAGRTLAARFAPTVVQDAAISDDRWGAVTWGLDRPEIDGETPTVYYYFSGYRYRERPALQILYVIWYPGRSGPHAPWI